jgi:hypothetical protein
MRVMPSATNLFAAVAMCILALYVSGLIPPLLDEGTDMGYFFYVNAIIGIVVGWKVVGGRTGRGWVAGVNAGLTGVVALVFWAIFVQACNEMVRLAMRNRFDGAFEALTSIFQIGVEWFLMILTAPIIGSLLVGAVLVGLVAEMAAQRWN